LKLFFFVSSDGCSVFGGATAGFAGTGLATGGSSFLTPFLPNNPLPVFPSAAGGGADAGFGAAGAAFSPFFPKSPRLFLPSV